MYISQGFLTAVRQEIIRAHPGWALDTTSLVTNVTKLDLERLKVRVTTAH